MNDTATGSNSASPLRSCFVYLIPIVLVAGGLLTIVCALQARRWIQDSLTHKASGVAMGINPVWLEPFAGAGDDSPGNPFQERLQAYLASVCQETPECRALLLLGRRPAQSVIVLADRVPAGSSQPSRQGEVFVEMDPQAQGVFGSKDMVFRYGARGVWRGDLSVYVPLKDPNTGRVLAALCMQFSNAEPNRLLGRAVLPPVLMTLALLVFAWAGLRFGNGSPEHAGRVLGRFGRWLREHQPSVLIAVSGALLSLALAHQMHQLETRSIFRNFLHLADSEHSRMLSRLWVLQDTSLKAAAHFIETNDAVTPEAFEHFIQAYRTRTIASAWAWAPKVTHEDRSAFEQEIREREAPSFQIWEQDASGERVPAGERSNYYPIRFIGPAELFQRNLGFDLGSEALRRASLEKALAGGLSTVTPALYSVMDSARHVLIALHPVIDPETSVPRGLVLASLYPKTLVQPLHGTGPVHHDLELVRTGEDPQTLATSCPIPGHFLHAMTRTSYLGVFNALFKLTSHPGPGFYNANPRVAAWITLAIGLLLTAASTLLFSLSLRSHRTLERMVADRTGELQRSEERYRLLVEQSRSVVYRLSPEGILTYLSPSTLPVMGFRPEELAGQNVRSLVHPDDVPAFESFLQEIMSGRATRDSIEYRVRHQDGTYRWHLSVLAVQSGSREDAGMLIGNATDISELKKAEAERERLLLEAEESRRVLLSMVEDQAQVEKELRQHESLLTAAAEAAQMLLSEKPLGQVVQSAMELIGRTVQQDRVYLFEHHLHPDTGAHRVSQRYEWVRDGIEPQVDSPMLKDLDFEAQCPRWFRLLGSGLPVEGVVREFPASERAILEPKDVVSLLAVPVLVEGRFWGFLGFDDCSKEHSWRNSERAVLTALAASFGSTISRRRNALELRQALERHQAFLAANPDIMFVFSPQGEFLDFNSNDRSVLFVNPSEFMNRNVKDVFPAPLAEEVLRNIRTVLESGTLNEFQYSLEVRNEVRHYESRMVRCGEDRVLAVVHDITLRRRSEEDRERLREQLLQSQKLDSVGRLAGGVAHDFNNMLQAILGHAELALEQVAPSLPIHADLVEIQKAANRSANLTRQLLAFARKQTVNLKLMDLNESVESLLAMLQRLMGENIELIWKPGEGIGAVRMDPSQLDQILANLCVNARDAIRDTGTVILETASATIQDEYLLSHEGAKTGEYVMLAVSDNGCGMDQETVANLFEPFFTTKRMGEGAGLGLSTLYGIVRQNGGFVQVYSEPGHGTTFKMFLPKADGAAVREAPTDRTLSSKGGGETILLVEDELAILQMARQMLTKLGYQVLAASSPDAAIRMAQSHTSGIDLLVTDVIMPNMNGSELATILLGVLPELKVLFMSGYTANVIAHYRVLDQGMHFIQKPFTVQELDASVRKALQRR